MLGYYTIYFRNSNKIENTIDTARIWHGIFFNILKEYNEEISAQYHEKHSKQSFSISPILSNDNFNKKYFDKYSLLKVNIALYTDEINKGLFQFIRKNKKVNFGDCELIMEEVSFKTIDEEIINNERVKRGSLKFITPTVFRINPVNSPLPNPRRIFKSLNKSYSEIFNKNLLENHDIEEIEKYVVIERFNINSVLAKYKKFNVTGFKGIVDLNIKHPDDIIQKNLERLFALANYVGIGYKTGMGMGQCIVLKK